MSLKKNLYLGQRIEGLSKDEVLKMLNKNDINNICFNSEKIDNSLMLAINEYQPNLLYINDENLLFSMFKDYNFSHIINMDDLILNLTYDNLLIIFQSIFDVDVVEYIRSSQSLQKINNDIEDLFMGKSLTYKNEVSRVANFFEQLQNSNIKFECQPDSSDMFLMETEIEAQENTMIAIINYKNISQFKIFNNNSFFSIVINNILGCSFEKDISKPIKFLSIDNQKALDDNVLYGGWKLHPEFNDKDVEIKKYKYSHLRKLETLSIFLHYLLLPIKYGVLSIVGMWIIFSTIFIFNDSSKKEEIIKDSLILQIGNGFEESSKLENGNYVVDDIQDDKLIIDDKEYNVDTNYTYLETMSGYTGKLSVQDVSNDNSKKLMFEVNNITDKDFENYMMSQYNDDNNYTYEEVLDNYLSTINLSLLLINFLIFLSLTLLGAYCSTSNRI